MNFYKRHIGDYVKDTAHLSLLEHGIYARLLDVYYTRERALPAFDATARLIGARSDEERSALRDVLNEFFIAEPDGFSHARCEREIAVASEAAVRSREVGKKGGRPKKVETQQVSAENPAGYFSEPTDNPSQTPDSRLQTPDTKSPLPPLAPTLSPAETGDSVLGGQDPPKGRDSTALAFLAAIREQTDDEPQAEHVPTAEGLMAMELRRRGVRCTSAHPELVALCADGYTVPEVVEALALACLSPTAPTPMGIGYLASVARTARETAKRPAKAAAAWWATDAGTNKKAAEFGMTARGGESWHDFRERIKARIAQGERA